MSESENERVFDQPDRIEYEYEDPDEFHRVQRLKQIHEARKQFDKGQHTVQYKANRGAISEEHAREVVAQLAVGFIRQLEPILSRTESRILDYEFTFRSDRVKHEVTARQILNTNGTVTYSKEVETFDPDTQQRGTKRERRQVMIPFEVSAKLVRLGDDFLEDVMPSGLVEAADGEADYEYDDLI
jgi:hypothetical protein